MHDTRSDQHPPLSIDGPFLQALRIAAPDLSRRVVDSLGAASSPYLENRGTSRDSPPPFWLADRLVEKRRQQSHRIAEDAHHALETAGLSFQEYAIVLRLAYRLTQCGEAIAIQEHRKEPGRFAPRVIQCQSRHCPPCAIRRSTERAFKLYEVVGPVAKKRRLTHAVFTIPSCPLDDLRDTVRRLRRALVRLRGGGGGRSRKYCGFGGCSGGIASVECTYNERRADVHPHIHALLDAEVLDQSRISSLWASACYSEGLPGVTSPVWLQRTHKRDRSLLGACFEVGKYISKPLDPHKTPPGVLSRIIWQQRGARLVDSWGSLHCRLSKPINPDPQWTNLGGIRVLLRDYAHTPRAQEALAAVLTDPIASRIFAANYSTALLSAAVPEAEDPVEEYSPSKTESCIEVQQLSLPF